MVRTTIVIIGAALLAGCATAPSGEELRAAAANDPAPDVDAGIAMIEAHLRSKLKDPDSAQFTWPNPFVHGWYQRPFGQRYLGWITCGTVNAKNSYGGYTGRTAAIGVIRSGSVVESNMDEPSDRYGSFVAEACRKIGVPVS